MPGWLNRQIDEIAGDRILRYYGLALAAVHAVTFLHWRFRHNISKFLKDGESPICWPFWENCHEWRVLSAGGIDAVLWAMLALSVAAAGLFLKERWARWGYWLLVAATAVRLLVFVQDFRLRLNQHYMLNWVMLAFLLLPKKRAVIPWLVVFFYFWAGILKLDMEWLSGAALYNRDKIWIPEALIPASCVYVVVLEIAIVFGLCSKRAWLFWSTFAQLVLFHVVSWAVVGFYYPMLMFGLISVFVTGRLLAPETEWISFGQLRDAALRPVLPLVIGVFSFFQMVPYAFPGDTAITGEGRLFALNMFDARVVCEAFATIHKEDGTTKDVPIRTDQLAQRITCDPIAYFNLARSNCRNYEKKGKFTDFDLHLRSRRTSDPEFRDVIDIRNFCTAKPTYDMWRPNVWILK